MDEGDNTLSELIMDQFSDAYMRRHVSVIQIN